MSNIERSLQEFSRACKKIPGGVNSPVRAFKSVGGVPLFIQTAKGAHVTDLDGNRYLDYVGSWGPMILGHSYESVTTAICDATQKGASFGAPTEAECELAELICSFVPSVELVRLVNSGTEATMSALRLARGFTKRDRVIKFEGCYHGHGDSFLISAGSGATTLGVPNSPGVTAGTAADTLVAKYNDLESVEVLLQKYPDSIAAIIVEPVAGNMGVIPPADDFLQGLRDLTHKYGAVLIFDEVMSGFRVAKGGAQELYSVRPDLTTFGKVIGGGLPVGAYGGRKDIMDMVAPIGPVYQAGTLAGNPLATAAGIATLRAIDTIPDFYTALEKNAVMLEKGLQRACSDHGIDSVLNRVGSMMTAFFTSNSTVQNYTDATTCDTQLYGRFFNEMLKRGIYMAPSQFEAAFVSYAHTSENIETTVKTAGMVLEEITSSQLK
ncbi:glutamate-1-semialdehyde 2,1-aminomutase [Chitinispirillales bacterium ANBcel5]|uniref:glutamate-1-semialdehyde 2,1-aminomutase n=1 Tax=Cellulosispirillum alkaliphilum TaxID=3039283 RepID=UPI002A54C0BE|nr:glutamate-1-semialdehyde 2,1-aminomutase [Chitinispirillales bacterium ANBcel5]